MQSLRQRPFDALLLACLGSFVLGWLTFDVPTTLGFEPDGVAYYATRIDPYHLQMPFHIRMIITVAAVLYGPIYLVLAWGIYRDANWTWKLALPFSGLLVATTSIHMTADITSSTPPLNLPAFVLFNGVYVVVGLLLMVRFVRAPRATP